MSSARTHMDRPDKMLSSHRLAASLNKRSLTGTGHSFSACLTDTITDPVVEDIKGTFVVLAHFGMLARMPRRQSAASS